ncbi:MAG: LptA/OstA family protein [Spirochaetales bacterium]
MGRLPRQSLLVSALCLVLAAPVFAAEDPFTFRGDRLTSHFTAGQEKTQLTGNATVSTGNLTIQADSIELSGKSFRYATCKGQVVVVDGKKNITIKADTMEYDRVLKLSRFRGVCEMQDPTNELSIRSGYFEYDEALEKFNMQIGVKIFKKDLVCRSENAVYARTKDSLELTGLPQVNKKKDEYKAGTIRVNLKTEEILLDGRVSGSITPAKETPAAQEAQP